MKPYLSATLAVIAVALGLATGYLLLGEAKLLRSLFYLSVCGFVAMLYWVLHIRR